MPAQDDDPLGAEAAGGDDAAEAHGAVADDGDRPAGPDLGGEGCVMTRRHHVGEREQRRHQRVLLADRQQQERAICLGDADRLALAAVHSVVAIPSSLQA